ncbi:MAG TPA: histidinol dehydrogenase [Treponemataceae bacterium]|nr:histidinol dehydrogenase [Treponemataceae bacterium]
MKPVPIINAKDIDPAFFQARKLGSDVHDAVSSILDAVKEHGDKALQDMAAKFDRASPAYFEIDKDEIESCANEFKDTNPELYNALEYSFSLALSFAKKQRECFTNFEIELEEGVFTGQKTIPAERAGLYVPAGRFPLFSSVIMCASPAKAAGCSELILCTPPRLHPEDIKAGRTKESKDLKPWADEGILTAAYICGIDRVFAVGGAHAIGAMSYGTESIPRCDVIAGPGNKYVTEAKKIIYGNSGIDFLAGPSEVYIIADESADPSWIAADMLAQAEHDPDAQAVLATPSFQLAEKVQKELELQITRLKSPENAQASLENNGLIILTRDPEEAMEIANKKAPEHLELALDDTEQRARLAEAARNYGSLFIGHETAEVFGDYCAGLNHTLPTSGSARFTGGLSVRHFLKTVTTLRTLGIQSIQKTARSAAVIGLSEGLEAHAKAAQIRMQH